MLEVIKKLRERRRDGEEGFTLIELMVVVLIIAILLAIAIPTFLGARKRAQDRAAQSSLRNALTAAKTIYTDNSSYSSADPTGLAAVEPSLTYSGSTTASTGQKNVSVSAADATWAGAALSKSGKCFFIKESAPAGTTFGSGTPCDGATAAGAGTTATEFPSS
ncbi:MAG: prepilin-type N-terminal cleavage/methylation domain-containing protein [Actinomycetota bacterium]|nr:prepilin-type N-terminal cleavage/methylation domain-containing protein [Actinomycetota bacterium]